MIVARRGSGIGIAAHGGRHALRREVRHDFSVCLNAFGTAKVVIDAIRSAPVEEYPDPTSRLACEAAANAWAVAPESVMLSAGSAELIDLICCTFIQPGDVVAVDSPAFGEYERAARTYGGRIVREIDDSARLTFVSSPSNPLGYVQEISELRAIADRCAERGGLLVLDQAYDAFATTPIGCPALRGHPAVVHLRSLTKEHAIPGVRVAFGVANAEIIRALTAVRVPWSASSIAQCAAIAAFTSEALAHVRDTVAELRAETTRLRRSLARMGYEANDSQTHFFTIRVRDSTNAQRVLLDRYQILVRDCMSFGLPDRIRVAARRPDANSELLEALSELATGLSP